MSVNLGMAEKVFDIFVRFGKSNFAALRKQLPCGLEIAKKCFAITFCILDRDYLDMQMAMFGIRVGWLIPLCDLFIS